MSYDRMAEAYASHRRIDPALLEALLQAGRIGPSSRVLDVGCGTGNYSIALQEVTGAACRGLDASGAMLAIARSRSGRVPFVRGIAETLPFVDACCDVVLFVDVIHHVRDPESSLAEAFRVARPGGAVCVATEDETGIRARLHARYFPDVVPVELARYPAIDRLRAAMKASGCSRIDERHTVSPLIVTDTRPYRDKAFSSLHHIPDEAHRAGLERMERDLASGPLEAELHHHLLHATK